MIREYFKRPGLITCVLALSLAIADVVSADDRDDAIPSNAQADRRGSGWSCDEGYREASGGCLAIKVPEHGFATGSAYGKGWECHHGYEAAGNACVLVDIPVNAFLTASGNGWKCKRGYRRTGARCVLIDVPENGYLFRADLRHRLVVRNVAFVRRASSACGYLCRNTVICPIPPLARAGPANGAIASRIRSAKSWTFRWDRTWTSAATTGSAIGR
jgi:hypothetical protein